MLCFIKSKRPDTGHFNRIYRFDWKMPPSKSSLPGKRKNRFNCAPVWNTTGHQATATTYKSMVVIAQLDWAIQYLFPGFPCLIIIRKGMTEVVSLLGSQTGECRLTG